MKTLKYDRTVEARLRNVSSLPSGTGCKYLLCIDGENGELIAKRWKRKIGKIGPRETVVIFG